MADENRLLVKQAYFNRSMVASLKPGDDISKYKDSASVFAKIFCPISSSNLTPEQLEDRLKKDPNVVDDDNDFLNGFTYKDPESGKDYNIFLARGNRGDGLFPFTDEDKDSNVIIGANVLKEENMNPDGEMNSLFNLPDNCLIVGDTTNLAVDGEPAWEDYQGYNIFYPPADEKRGLTPEQRRQEKLEAKELEWETKVVLENNPYGTYGKILSKDEIKGLSEVIMNNDFDLGSDDLIKECMAYLYPNKDPAEMLEHVKKMQEASKK